MKPAAARFEAHSPPHQFTVCDTLTRVVCLNVSNGSETETEITSQTPEGPRVAVGPRVVDLCDLF